MSSKYYLFFLGLFLCKHASAQNRLDEMIRAEKSFAAYSVLHGTKEAFLRFADTASTLFTNGEPVNGYQLWQSRENKPGVLNWRPRYAMFEDSVLVTRGGKGASRQLFGVKAEGGTLRAVAALRKRAVDGLAREMAAKAGHVISRHAWAG